MGNSKDCRERCDNLLKDAVKEKRSIMRETLDALSEEVKKFKEKTPKLATQKAG